MIRYVGKHDFSAFTEADLVAWIASGNPANNTARQRISMARTFFARCMAEGICAHNPAADLRRLQRSYPATYGKVQDTHPARWLDSDEAFGALIGACQDGTEVGLQDEIIIRLGLAGMRASEILHLTWGDISSIEIRWTGKGRKPRRIVPGVRLLAALDAYRSRWTQASGTSPAPTQQLVCKRTQGGNWKVHRSERTELRWTVPATNVSTIWRIVTQRASQAGLGHVAPHDLRRSAAGILHRSKTTDGGHRFDLLDIQKILGHSDPATTMRSYLDPMDTEVIDRAAQVLD